MKSRKHLRTVLFVAGMLAIGTTMGAALLIERQGGGTQTLGKKDGVGGAVGRPTHAPMASSTAHSEGPDGQAEAVQGGAFHWNPPASVSWSHGNSGGGAASGWSGAEHEWPAYYLRPTAHSTVTYTVVGTGPDNTAAGRVAYYRGTESAPSMGSVFGGVPSSLSPAPASSRDVVAFAAPITPPVPEPSEWMMLAVGLLFIGTLARRRSRQH